MFSDVTCSQRIHVGPRSLAKQRARTKPTDMVAERRGRDTPWRGSREHISERVDEQVVDLLEVKRADLAEAEKNLTTSVTHQAVSNKSCTQVASDHEDCVKATAKEPKA